MNQPPVRLIYRLLSYLVSGLLATQPLLPAVAAKLTPTGNTTMDKAANGVPVVNIATPNEAGISHNQFKDYNVGKEGLILNNATGKLNQTQLGGLINGNARLKAGMEAKGIINEVTGGNRSQLQGYTEVAGKAANVMVANPYGITCNGCGFINTPQATLTTGRPVLDASGNLQALDVKKGSITIEGQGLDASSSDALSIISRATEVNAAIYARDLKVVAGANRVGTDGSVQAQQGEGNAPTVAVDTGALGGMYANRIHLVSSEKGVGVNLGDLNARQGDITLDASGKLNVHNSLASRGLTAKGEGLGLTGDHKSGGNMMLSSKGDIALSNGSLNSDGDLVLNASGTLTHTSEKLTAGRDATLTAKNIRQDAASQINAARDIAAKASDTLQTQGQMTAGQNLTVSGNTLTQDGRLLAHNSAQLKASTLNNSGSVQGASLSVGSSTLSNSGSLLSGGNLTVSTKDFTQSGSTGAKGKADITASGKLTNTGSLVSDDVLVLKAQDVAQNGVLSGGKGLTVNAQTLTSGKNSVTHSDAAMTLNTTTATLDGETSAGGDLQLQGDRLTTAASAQLQSGNNLSLSAREAALAGTQAAQKNMTVNAREKLTHSGKSSAASLSLSAPELTNSGVLVASSLNTQSQTLTNSGLMQGESALLIDTQKLDNQQNGTLYSAANLTLDIPDIRNSGLITSDSGVTLSAGSLSNPGKIIADTLNVKVSTLNGDGLLQGSRALTLAGDTLSQGSNGRWLTAGDLSLSGKTLNTAGTTQGQNLTAQAASWTNSGSVLATGNLNATLSAALLNNGDLMSQGNVGLNAPVLTNHGSILSSGDMSLAGTTFTSDGTLQGNTLSLRQNSIDNRGTAIGLNGLALNSTGRLTNSGDLLSQKALTLSAGDVTNSGRLQGQNIALDGSSLNNSGAIQSALDLALTLSGDVIAATGSKLTALGDARLTGKALSNQGLISAKTLEVKGDSLSNGGEISGVNGLNIALSGNLQQQGKMLTGGLLNVSAKDIINSGQLQGADTQISASSLTNSGRVQGDSGLTLTLLNALTNQASGVLLSQNALSLTAPVLTNDGTIQGNGKTTLSPVTQARNGGKILSGGDLTFTTPDYSGSGWLQATNLVLNVAKLAGNGTVIAANQATLTGNSLDNGGTFQAAQLNVNVQTITNTGTLLGNQGLTLKGNSLNNAGGKVFSGGDMLAEMVSLSGVGQLVALGNLTLKLTNGFTTQGVIAANKQLSISSQGDITNGATLQGNGITLNAAGKLTNNGQLTAGNGTTALSGSQIAMNASGSLQAVGDVGLTSRGNINLDGFTGTAGSLLLNATGAVINTALLYAGNNLSLFANSIQNLRGDMLAGNNLVMHKDASGTANAEVVNTSGNIETTKGNITINTQKLLNQREGIQESKSYIPAENSPGANGGSSISVRVGDLAADEWGYYFVFHGTNYGGSQEAFAAPTAKGATRRFLAGTKIVDITATGGVARVASGNNILINATTLDNLGGNILANDDINISGSRLNNQSYFGYAQDEYNIYTYYGRLATQLNNGHMQNGNAGSNDRVTYSLSGSPEYVVRDSGQALRSVIQAGKNVLINFSSDISNTSTISNAGGITNTIVTPVVNAPSEQNIGGGASQQTLSGAGIQFITHPDWKDISSGQTIGSGMGLEPGGMDGNYPLPSGNNGYFVPSTDPDSPYLITVNPKLDGLGQLDPSLFGDLYKLLGMKPDAAPRETGSQYTNVRQFLGSSYMLDRLSLNPDRDYRFLGDAAFDTRYVSNTVLNQTGTRYINGLGSDLDQMRYLMDNAANTQSSLGLTFGVALTADQVAALDHSILWYETATINGQTVMVPKVYLSPKDVTVQSGSVISGNNVHLAGGNVTNSGSSLLAQNGLTLDSSNSIDNLSNGLIRAGENLILTSTGDINNISSGITGKTVQLESLDGSINNITQSGRWQFDAPEDGIALKDTYTGSIASITATDDLSIRAGNDISVTGAEISAGASAELVAGNDLNLNAIENSTSSRHVNQESHQRSAELTAITAGDNVTLVAGRDVTSQAAGIVAGGNVGIQAGRDVSLLAEASVTGSSSHSKKNTVIDESIRQQGTEIASSGNTTIIAGRDLNAEAAQVTASGDIGVAAGRDVNLTTATESDYHYKEETKTKKGFLSKKTTHTIEEDIATREAGTLLSGDNVTVQAGNNLLVKGSSVVGDNTVALSAGNNVDIVAATNTDSSWRFKETKKSGLMGTGGIGITVGSSKSTHDLREAGTTQSQSFSTVGSTGGNVVITAGNQAHIGGADLIAGKDMSLSGSSVIIDPGHDKRTRDETFEQKKSGLTLALSGTVGSAINNAVTSAQGTKEESDGRLKALQATKTVLSGVQAGQAAEAANLTADPNAMGVSLSLTTQKSKSQQHAESDAVTGSTLNVGNNLSITANGKGKGPNSGDIVIAGSQLKAGGDTLLGAKNDIILSGAANTQQSSGKNSSSGGGVGVSIGAGKGAGISVFANVNAAKGKENGNGTDRTETTIDSGKTVTITSGNDTMLNGAQVNGNKIVADVGHDLLMSSQQDSNKYDSKQNSLATGGSFTFGSMTGSGYLSASQDKMKSRFDSVAEQTGIFAGDGGFDITVGNHTQLDGAVIASSATADKNSLETGTLGFTDIHNEADFKTQHSGISISGAGSFGDQFKGNMPGGVISAAGNKGHAEGITQAAVADSTITIRDKDNQKQDVANLSRDTEHANDSISPIFDKEKEQNRLMEIGMISDIGGQVADIARTQGELNALKVAQDKYGPLQADATEEQRQAYLAKLRETPEYKKEQEKFGTGSDIQRGIQAATAALQGLAGGNLAGALAGASAPELAHLLKSTEGNPAVNAIAHAILGGAVAALQGNSAAAGAVGAGGGELAARAISNMLYPGVDKLSEEQKQTVSALASISAGLAGGIATGNSAGAATGAGAGKNAVENNALSDKDKKLPIIDIRPGWLKPGVVDTDGDVQGNGGKVIIINKSKYPESAKHIEDAQAAGKPAVLTIDRSGAAQRRQESLKDTPPVKGSDRDEYPPAMFKEGGTGASVRPIAPSDNRGAGACIGAQCRNLPDGTSVIIKTDGGNKK
ncbi:filamentous hemagglutinin N-terminal domain-containing protein [Salmonella enterica subsp. enterica serovar Java]|nr:filamentous hemagglutinin N-terminal domain-containing protein [Salmonella enterica]ECE8725993.1 filamentous hemagglutinin N-terminal domain-containing protein [Salmonella enterica subsp. enterica serovar Java]EDR9849137.1 filamentous hemagglutinin N-terminal domain-containing protein [Salmonella enterica subsp. enterica]EAR4481826.1 filamentous hemagglutinin N-terminal domain-containing protein [Salmonella enterica]EAU8491160.1 filamentous hemagglutinin N-terminal domain-containing protein 